MGPTLVFLNSVSTRGRAFSQTIIATAQYVRVPVKMDSTEIIVNMVRLLLRHGFTNLVLNISDTVLFN